MFRPRRWRFDPSVVRQAEPRGYISDTNGRGLCCSATSVKKNGGHETLPVLIVGAGPVGLVLSMLLSKLGDTHSFFLRHFVHSSGANFFFFLL